MLQEPFILLKKTYPYATQRVDIFILKKLGLKVIITLFLILKFGQSRSIELKLDKVKEMVPSRKWLLFHH